MTSELSQKAVANLAILIPIYLGVFFFNLREAGWWRNYFWIAMIVIGHLCMMLFSENIRKAHLHQLALGLLSLIVGYLTLEFASTVLGVSHSGFSYILYLSVVVGLVVRLKYLSDNRNRILYANIESTKLNTKTKTWDTSIRSIIEVPDSNSRVSLASGISRILIPLLPGLSFLIVRNVDPDIVRFIIGFCYLLFASWGFLEFISQLFLGKLLRDYEKREGQVIYII